MPFIFLQRVALIFKLHNDLVRKITLTGLKSANRVMFRAYFHWHLKKSTQKITLKSFGKARRVRFRACHLIYQTRCPQD